ncbi:heme-binding protein [Sphingomonas montanisoli]|uniref:Heme-binding protein n=1 Tax=Sphingomonas montanisoli TaxID=2606412 RepID=A0A5D9C3Y7_9SPHN|nr:heme-binding protein [Sphingomonas montanisoli]TZG24625.1 hypothetical protein FYJ91_18555 [Sphingomonas montanisoli]
MKVSRLTAFVTSLSFVLASCGGGGGGSSSSNGGTPPSTATPDITITSSVFTAPSAQNLTSADVGKIIAQSTEEAAARGKPAVIAVTDRVGNVLGVFTMNGAPKILTVGTQASERTVTRGDLEGLVQGPPAAAPDASVLVAGAIAKAVTGAYLSSSGNAFSTRTASYIVQEHFPKAPNTIGLESGPLFGVQFSSTPCSDLNTHYTPGGSFLMDAVTQLQRMVAANIGPKRSPLGLSADPGGIPLYKNGVVVGGLGVMSDGLYSYDGNSVAADNDPDEFIALAGSAGFEAPDAIRANRISIDGTLLAYSEATTDGLRSNPGNARAFAAINGTLGSLTPVRGYYAQTGAAALLDGQTYGTEASGIRPATAAERSAGTVVTNPDAFILTDGSGNNRFPIRAGTDAAEVAQPLTAAEVRAIQEEAFLVMAKARAAIRKPDDSRAQVSLSIVDTRGSILAVVRSPDAPIFGIDVAIEKARTAAFFSNPRASADLTGNPNPGVSGSPSVASYAAAMQSFTGQNNILTGGYGVSARVLGLLARPYFPDGEVGKPNGPLSRPFAAWSPFSVGLQSTLVTPNILQHVGFILGGATDTPQRCTTTPAISGTSQNRLQNGIQIFPGGTPIFRGNVLVGAIGISGDGIDQDDMISFLGTFNGSQRPLTVGLAPLAMRASQIAFPQANGGKLPYVQCPVQEFAGSSATLDICSGK